MRTRSPTLDASIHCSSRVQRQSKRHADRLPQNSAQEMAPSRGHSRTQAPACERAGSAGMASLLRATFDLDRRRPDAGQHRRGAQARARPGIAARHLHQPAGRMADSRRRIPNRGQNIRPRPNRSPARTLTLQHRRHRPRLRQRLRRSSPRALHRLSTPSQSEKEKRR